MNWHPHLNLYLELKVEPQMPCAIVYVLLCLFPISQKLTDILAMSESIYTFLRLNRFYSRTVLLLSDHPRSIRLQQKTNCNLLVVKGRQSCAAIFILFHVTSYVCSYVFKQQWEWEDWRLVMQVWLSCSCLTPYLLPWCKSSISYLEASFSVCPRSSGTRYMWITE